MITALLLLTLYALVTAISASLRAFSQVKPVKAPIPDPRSISKSSVSKSIDTVSSNVENTVRDIESKAAKPQLQPDLDSTQPATAVSSEAPEAPVSQPSTEEASHSSGIAFAPFAPQPEADIPLATSLTVSEVVHPSETEPQIDLGITQHAPAHESHHASVVEEVTHLEHDGEKLEQLAQQANHSDGNVRIVVAAELGEFAAQGNERAIAILNQLSQDVDPQVRVQAAASLGTRV